MALIGSAAVWKTAVMGTLNTTDLNAGEIATLEAFWLGVLGVHITHITANSLINTIVATPDTLKGTGLGTPPITGIK